MNKGWLSIVFFLLSSHLVAQRSQEIAQQLGLGSAFSQGVSIVDINEDGYDDIFVTRRNRDNQFFLNKGDGTFVNIADEAGVDDVGISALTIWQDFDQDGDQDFFLGMEAGRSKLFLNNGDITFSDISESTLGEINGFVAAAQWGDVNGDGWADLFVFLLDGSNRYFFNDGNGSFNEVTQELKLVDKRLTMGAVLFDFDQDLDLDLYMTHDGFGGNHLLVNDGKGNFTDQSEMLGIYTETDAMGVSIGDYNNDGWEDIYLTNLYENQLFENNQGLGFKEVAQEVGVDDYGMGWGVSWLDYNNDGHRDLYVANDSYFSDYDNLVYQNDGEGNFQKQFLGQAITSKKASYATAISDLNNDGHEEIILTNRGNIDRIEVFEIAPETEMNWVSFQIGDHQGALIGARIEVKGSDQKWVKSMGSGTSWAGEDSDWLKFGIGNDIEVDVKVYWPSGAESVYRIENINTFYKLMPDQVIEVIKPRFSLTSNVVTAIEGYDFSTINTYVSKYININIYEYTKICIYTYDGILIYYNTFSSLDQLDLGTLKRGVYMIELATDEGVHRTKFFKD